MKNDQIEPKPSPLSFQVTRKLVTGVILAGGHGSRLGGVDKGWVDYHGHPLIEHVIRRLTPQTEQILIVANRNIERYRSFGHTVVQDEIAGFQGPLAGIHAALQMITTPLALVVPTDAPLLPNDLLKSLASKTKIDATLDHPVLSFDGEREQPLFGIYPKSLAAALEHYLAQHQRRLMQWCKNQHAEWIDLSEKKEAFANMNTPAQLNDEGSEKEIGTGKDS